MGASKNPVYRVRKGENFKRNRLEERMGYCEDCYNFGILHVEDGAFKCDTCSRS